MKKRVFSKEWRKKISESKKGVKNPLTSGEKNCNWKGGKSHCYGYIIIRNPDFYTGKSKQRYVKEHRLIMEKFRGRKLSYWEEVHHINGIKTDNRLVNLRIVSKTNHNGKFTCPHCQKEMWIK